MVLPAVNAILEYHIPSRRLYFYDTAEKVIYSCNVDGSNKTTVSVVDSLEDFVVNELNKDIYFIKTDKRVFSFGLNGTTETVLIDGVNSASGIDMDSENQ